MKTTLTIIGVIIALVIIVVFMIGGAWIGCYNGIIQASNKVDASWGNVQNVYQRRLDLIPNLVNTVQAAAKFEKSTFVEVSQARASVGKIQTDMKNLPATAAELKQFQDAQTGLSSALSRLMVVTENYPQLKANENFRDLQAQLEGTENRIAVERRNFNLAVQDYNNQIQSFFGRFVAGTMGKTTPKPEFQAEDSAQKAPTVQFN